MKRLSLATLSVLFAALSLLLGIAGYTYYQREFSAVQRNRYQELQAIAALKVAQISGWRQERLADAGFGAHHLAMHQDFLHRKLPQGGVGTRTEAMGLLKLIQDRGGYQNALLASPDGTILAASAPGSKPLDPEAKALVRKVLEQKRASIGELRKSPGSPRPHLDVAAPIIGPEGDAKAALLLITNPESRLFPIIRSWPTPSETAETLLVRKDGEDVLFLNRLRHLTEPALGFRQPLSRRELPAARAVSGGVGAFIGLDYRQVEVLADLRPIPDSSWFMIAKVDAKEILAEARYRGRVVVGFMGLGILIIAAVLGFLFYLGQAKLYQELFQTTRCLAREDSTLDPLRSRLIQRTVRGAGLFAIAAGGSVLAGWAWHIAALKSLLPGFVSVKPNTAVGFLFAGTALCLLTSPLGKPRLWAKALAGALLLMAVLTFAQYPLETDFHIDQLLFREAPGAVAPLVPGRMALATAISFILLGCSLLLACSQKRAALAQWLVLPVVLFSILPLLGYFYGAFGAYGLGPFFQLAILTGFTLIVLSLGTMLLHPTSGFVKHYLADTLGGWLLRRMLVIIPAISILIGWIRTLGEKFHWYDHATGAVLIVMAFAFLFAWATWETARSLDQMDTVRRRAEAKAWEGAAETRATLYGIGEGVIATDTQGHLIHMNPAAEQITGWTEAEALV